MADWSTYLPYGMQGGRQVSGGGVLPLGDFVMPDGSRRTGVGLPNAMLDAYRTMRYGLGYEQDPEAPEGYVSQNAMLRGAAGAAGAAMTGPIGANAMLRTAFGTGNIPRNRLFSGGFLSKSDREAFVAAIKAALDDPDNFYGLRVNDPDVGHPVLKKGDKAQESRQWYQDYEAAAKYESPEELARMFPDHDAPLGGTATVGLTPNTSLDDVLKRYYGSNVSLLRSPRRIHGTDAGEWILPDAEAVAVWNR